MFTAHFHIRFAARRSTPAGTTRARTYPAFAEGGIPRFAALSALLALGMPLPSSAQSIGTMQVTARVVPASAAWTGVGEAGAAVRAAARERPGRFLVRRDGLAHARSEIGSSEGRRILLVTIHYPHN